MHVYRDAAAVVGYAHNVARQQDDLDVVGKTTHGFVAGVVKNFPNEVVQTVGAGCPDVHTRAASDSLEPFEHCNVCCGVVAFLFYFFVLFFSFFVSHICLLVYQKMSFFGNPYVGKKPC
jgi:hypothetical protein